MDSTYFTTLALHKNVNCVRIQVGEELVKTGSSVKQVLEVRSWPKADAFKAEIQHIKMVSLQPQIPTL